MNTEKQEIYPTQMTFISWPEWLLQYFNELTLGKVIESAYLM